MVKKRTTRSRKNMKGGSIQEDAMRRNLNNILSDIELFKVRSIGLHIDTKYVKMDKIYTNPQHQLFALLETSQSYLSYISKKVHDEPGTSIVSALHCQAGYESTIGKIELAFEKEATVGGKRKRISKRRKQTPKICKNKRKRTVRTKSIKNK